MLILTRKVGECIVVGDTIKIHIIEVRGQQVRVGIEAPEDTTIYREEIYRKIAEENRLASNIELNHLLSIEGQKE